MATLERRRSEDVAPAAVRVLDGTVPAPFDRAGLEYESDLIDLGQEQLFSGCTGGSARHALDVEAQTRSLQVRCRLRPSPVLNCPGAARHARRCPADVPLCAERPPPPVVRRIAPQLARQCARLSDAHA